MRRLWLPLAGCAVSACLVETGKEVPLVEGGGPGVAVEKDSQKVRLDATRVPVVESCAAGQLVRRTAEGWECAPPEVPWTSVTGRPGQFPPSVHAHALAEITDLISFATGEWPGTTSWDRISGLPPEFAPEQHGHALAEITDLMTFATGEWPGSTSWDRIPDLPPAFTPEQHSHALAEITDLMSFATGEWPGTVSWLSVTDARTDSEWPGTAQWLRLLGRPAAFPPEAHLHGLEAITDAAESVWPGSASWDRINDLPPAFPPDFHMHLFSDITDTTTDTAWPGTTAWSRIEYVPEEFAPAPHSHVFGDIDISDATTEGEVDAGSELRIKLPSAATRVLGVQAWVWDPGTARWKLYNQVGGVRVTQAIGLPVAGLVGWWKMDEASGDRADSSSPGGHTLVAWSGGTPSTEDAPFFRAARFGMFGSSSLNLTASSFMNSSLDIKGSNFSCAVWLRMTGTSFAGFNTVAVLQRADGYQCVFATSVTGTAATLMVAPGPAKYPYLTGLAVPVNFWHHYAATYDGSTVLLYRDGTLLTQWACAASDCLPTGNTSDIQVGGQGASNYLYGDVDDLAFFARTLTAQEVASIYRYGVGGGMGIVDDLVIEHDPATGVVSLINHEIVKLTLRLTVAYP